MRFIKQSCNLHIKKLKDSWSCSQMTSLWKCCIPNWQLCTQHNKGNKIIIITEHYEVHLKKDFWKNSLNASFLNAGSKMGHNVRRGRKSLIEKYQLLITVEPLLMATSRQWPLFFVPTDDKSIHWLLFLNKLLFLKNLSTTATSFQQPLSSVHKVAVLERFNCIILNFIIIY